MTNQMTYMQESGHRKSCCFVEDSKLVSSILVSRVRKFSSINHVIYVTLLVYVYLSRTIDPCTRAHTGTRSSPRDQGTCHHWDKLSHHIHRYLQKVLINFILYAAIRCKTVMWFDKHRFAISQFLYIILYLFVEHKMKKAKSKKTRQSHKRAFGQCSNSAKTWRVCLVN